MTFKPFFEISKFPLHSPLIAKATLLVVMDASTKITGTLASKRCHNDHITIHDTHKGGFNTSHNVTNQKSSQI